MMKLHPELRELESSRSLSLTLPILIFGNLGLLSLSLFSASLSFHKLFLLAFTVGSTLSLWQLQILHECLHGSMLGVNTALHRNWHKRILFFGSMPSAFGYWLYLRFGHLSHHRAVGAHSLNDAFTSPTMDLSDGDVLFVNHRMKMVGEAGPQLSLKGGKTVTVAIGRSGFSFWKRGRPLRNAATFAASFLIERALLLTNDAVVATTGRNYFFPNKPPAFHSACASYARVAVALRLSLVALTKSWKPLLFLMLSETLWSLPPHPACAMFVTNHGCDEEERPTSSTYTGRWYSVLTLGTNYHCEHHDFPTMPLHKLGEVRRIVGDRFYKLSSGDNLGGIMRKAFGEPEFYACMDVGVKDMAP